MKKELVLLMEQMALTVKHLGNLAENAIKLLPSEEDQSSQAPASAPKAAKAAKAKEEAKEIAPASKTKGRNKVKEAPKSEVIIQKEVVEEEWEDDGQEEWESESTPEKTYTLEDARKLCAELSKMKGADEVKALIKSFGVDKIAKIPEAEISRFCLLASEQLDEE